MNAILAHNKPDFQTQLSAINPKHKFDTISEQFEESVKKRIDEMNKTEESLKTRDAAIRHRTRLLAIECAAIQRGEDSHEAFRKINKDLLKEKEALENAIKNAPLEHKAAQQSSGECMICMDRVPTTVFVPCGHFIACGECADMLPNNKCPMCREEFIMKTKVFKT